MIFEAKRISEHNYQIFTIDEYGAKAWLASFNSLANLLNYYIHCHNMTFDEINFTGSEMTDEEKKFLEGENSEWGVL